MRYAIKGNNGMYLYSGNMFYEYTEDVYKARTFKKLETAKKHCEEINKNAQRTYIYPAKVVGIELVETELN